MAENQTDTTGSAKDAKPATTAKSKDTLVLKAGDTLGAIAAKHKTTVRDLVALNDLGDARNIRVGQTIRLK